MICLETIKAPHIGCQLLDLKDAKCDTNERTNKKLLFMMCWKCLAPPKGASIGDALRCDSCETCS